MSTSEDIYKELRKIREELSGVLSAIQHLDELLERVREIEDENENCKDVVLQVERYVKAVNSRTPYNLIDVALDQMIDSLRAMRA
jgi:hypothetical protein